MDENGERDLSNGVGRMRYRIAVTLIDQQAGRARVALYDSNSVEVAHGPMERDPFTRLLVQEVRIRLPAALAMCDDLSRVEEGGGDDVK